MKNFAALVSILAASCCAQTAGDTNAHYQTPAEREAMAQRLGRASRDETQKPRQLVEDMALKPGTVVADIGTGSGYMLPYLSSAVGPKGRVLAEDVFDEFLSAARRKAESERLANVSVIKGGFTDPQLPGNGVDVALALDSYHHWDRPGEMLASIRRALCPGGRFIVVEYYKRPGAISGQDAVKHVRLDQPGVVQEIEAAGFRLMSQHATIPGSQYMLVFLKPGN